jgi:predicted flap endonuclease-1-like 5' DNA nuclease
MMTVIDANILPIIIAVVIGFIIGFWMFRRARTTKRETIETRPQPDSVDALPAQPPPAPVRPYMRSRPIRDGIDTVEGRGVADEGAAAIRNVAGEVLGISQTTETPSSEDTPADDLQMLKGVGPKLAEKLRDNGITRFEQLAQLSPNEVTMLDAKLGPFKGRLERDRVVEQASYLARGDRDGFEARFGKLGSG